MINVWIKAKLFNFLYQALLHENNWFITYSSASNNDNLLEE